MGCQSSKGKKLSSSRSQKYLLVTCALFTELYPRGCVEEKEKKKSLVPAFEDSRRHMERKTAEGHKEQSKKSTANKINTIQRCVINQRH